jgi:glycosyltransferase involved in cell wall biosynthesis
MGYANQATEASGASISVIMPVNNGAAYLVPALDSVLAQTIAPAEIVVVDDGSSDATPGILDRYRDRIRTLRQPHSGCATARNLGVDMCRGDLITFMDCDDIMHPRRLELSLAALEANPGTDLCLHFVENFWIDGMKAERERFRDHPIAKPQIGYLLPAMLAWRPVIERVGAFDPAYEVGEDTDWFIRAEEQGLSIVAIDQTLLYRRIHRNNITRRKATLAKDSLARMVHAARKRRAGGSQKQCRFDFPLGLPSEACLETERLGPPALIRAGL